ncbi:alpha/beta fold hydrolase [Pigmentibacter sp. JX0631]|uniref:alpha/beta fold hydrolase n=1 Tax=Pigmentibacter sp. JX0631 TaxID=2976982 RepID=UPI002469A0E0|nr:alpha/beta fold hydrolase [Pigmentibacter sp. JX0631]WGL60278.1 alpha/beta fold hydrolase [Pigmentibacter sp. JX0631]
MENFEDFIAELKKENSPEEVNRNTTRYNEEIIPFYKNHGITEEFKGVDDLLITCKTFHAKNPVAKVILCTGYNESYLKYCEFIHNLYEMDISVYCFDHRGQGFSGRFLNQQNRGYVDKFSNYINDLSFFFEHVSSNEKNLPIFIIAHSMGGAITALAVNQKKVNPNGIILCAPMFEIMLAPYHFLELPIFYLSRLFCKINLDKKYAIGQADCIPFRPFAGNDVTHSLFRYNVWRKHISEIDDLQLGGPTYGWLKESINASIYARHINNLHNVPCLLIQAQEDTVVRNSAHQLFLKNNPHCEFESIEFAKHEILMEADVIRNRALYLIQNFITKKIGK